VGPGSLSQESPGFSRGEDSIHGTETYTSVRPADPGDAIDPAELYALLDAHRAKPPATRFNVVA
jgi:hypothetical protein